MENETNEEYTAKDFGKDVAVSAAVSAASVVAGMLALAAVGQTIIQVEKFRARRAAKKAATEE